MLSTVSSDETTIDHKDQIDFNYLLSNYEIIYNILKFVNLVDFRGLSIISKALYQHIQTNYVN